MVLILRVKQEVSCRRKFLQKLTISNTLLHRTIPEMPQGLTLQMAFMMLMMLLFWPGWIATGQLIPEPIVDTQYGQVLGNRKLYEGLLYDEYLGIPFAAPPVDELRWERPQPPEPWDDVLNATQFSIHCTQLIAPIYRFVGMGGDSGEDCLYLNVWVAGGVKENVTIAMPVMVFFYGGGFILGTGEMYPGYALALHGEMVVVNFNYRLSTLGWLSTEDSNLPGNYGLWDIKLALEWVRDNIAAFNGDPNQVTIFGQSAGASLTSHAVISPQTNTLFNNAISISGYAVGPFGVTTQALRTAVLMANIFNCTYNTTQDIVDCLREKDPHDLDFWGLTGASMYENRTSNLKPVIDGDFIVRPPRESWELGEGSHINFITGFCHDDAASFVIGNPIGLPFLWDKLNVAETSESLWEFFMEQLGETENPEELAESIYSVYPEMYSTDNHTRTLAASKCRTEWSFGSGSNLEAVIHRNFPGSGNTFQYYFHYRNSFLVGYPEWINGTHLDDIYNILGWPFFEPFRRIYLDADFNEQDLIVSETIMNYYANFARTGDPNVGPYPVVTPWDPFDPTEQNFLRESNNFEAGNFYEDNMVERFQYWTEVFPTLVQLPPDPEIPPSLADFPAPTEEEIENGIEILKAGLYDMMADEESWAAVEEAIDYFVEKRRSGYM